MDQVYQFGQSDYVEAVEGFSEIGKQQQMMHFNRDIVENDGDEQFYTEQVEHDDSDLRLNDQN